QRKRTTCVHISRRVRFRFMNRTTTKVREVHTVHLRYAIAHDSLTWVLVHSIFVILSPIYLHDKDTTACIKRERWRRKVSHLLLACLAVVQSSAAVPLDSLGLSASQSVLR